MTHFYGLKLSNSIDRNTEAVCYTEFISGTINRYFTSEAFRKKLPDISSMF